MPTNITTNQPKLTLPPTGNAVPAGVPLVFDFTSETSYIANLSVFAQQGNIGGVNAMWVDTTGMTGDLEIAFGQSGQIVRVKANMQGWTPILCPNPIQLTATASATGGSASIFLINYYVAPYLWATA